MFNYATGENDFAPAELLRFTKILQMLSADLVSRVNDMNIIMACFNKLTQIANCRVEEDRLYAEFIPLAKENSSDVKVLLDRVNKVKDTRHRLEEEIKQRWQTMLEQRASERCTMPLEETRLHRREESGSIKR